MSYITVSGTQDKIAIPSLCYAEVDLTSQPGSLGIYGCFFSQTIATADQARHSAGTTRVDAVNVKLVSGSTYRLAEKSLGVTLMTLPAQLWRVAVTGNVTVGFFTSVATAGNFASAVGGSTTPCYLRE
jgi:hypothetical protein